MLEFLSSPALEAGAAKVYNGQVRASDTIRDLVILGLNHEQQHQELFITDLKYTFSVNPLFPAYREEYAPEDISESGIRQFHRNQRRSV